MSHHSKRPRRYAKTFAVGGVIGAAVMYFFDPRDGRRRRALVRDRTTAMGRDAAREAERKTRYYSGKAQGVAHAIDRDGGTMPADDATLKDKIQSEVLRDFDSHAVNVNVDDGAVTLRGELRRPEDIRALEDRVRQIRGVADVRNMLHLPRTPTPGSGGSV